jgi:hypothetical protein
MRTILSILFYFGFCLRIALCDSTAGMTEKSQTLRGIYEWAITEKQILATPEWTDSQPIPLTIDKALQLAKEWLGKHDYSRFHLNEIRLLPYLAPWETPPNFPHTIQDDLRKRYYYWIEYSSGTGNGDYIYVYVLLDGTVIEPKIIAPPPPTKTR